MFPQITHISDVLPYIEGKDEFIKVDKGPYTVIDYVYAKEDTFDNDYARECRGIKFDSRTGALIARPYHKFFNLGERVGFREEDLDFTRPHVLLDKLDGSMVHPILLEDKLHLCTRMGITEHAVKAQKLLREDQEDWLRAMVNQGYTPLLEWVAPENQIVLHYDEPRLVLTGVRHNKHGHYIEYVALKHAPFYIVSNDVPNRYAVKQAEGIEGIIVRFANGEMVKVKSDWYVARHKVKSHFENEENILTLVLDGQADDIIPLLDGDDLVRFQRYRQSVIEHCESVVPYLNFHANKLKLSTTSRKEFAQEVQRKVSPEFQPLWFAAYDNKFTYSYLAKHIKKTIGKPDWRMLIGNVEWK